MLIKIEELKEKIINKQDRTQKIELDLHQIMKIEKIIESVFYIEFDYLQSVTITIVNLVENGEDK